MIESGDFFGLSSSTHGMLYHPDEKTNHIYEKVDDEDLRTLLEQHCQLPNCLARRS
jgi:hypothetical protein